jgi:membrane protein involved in D-alanine export
MTPYSDFLYFGVFLYLLLPTLALGLLGKANRHWALACSVLTMLLHFGSEVPVSQTKTVTEIFFALGFLCFEAALATAFLRWKNRGTFYSSVVLAAAPLAAAKFLPLALPHSAAGFLGISYVTFRALDVILSIHDGAIQSLNFREYVAYLFFFPTISSGPIDRFRRFKQDWNRQRNRQEFLADLDLGVDRVFRGFLYKFLIAALIRTYWMDRVELEHGWLHGWSYMYAYTFYLFFDFAGYSAFAIGFSHLFGVRVGENFNRPFLAHNIRDFWNRWHISLSFWFRDHVYMRFLLAAAKGKWFKGKHTSSYLGLFLTFGLMGIWHGPHLHYILYGLYHAVLLSCFDWFSRWNKERRLWPDGPKWRVFDTVLTFHAVAFGLLLFSGHLTRHA